MTKGSFTGDEVGKRRLTIMKLMTGSVLIIFAYILLPFPSFLAFGQVASWKWQNPLPQGNPLNSVWGSSGTDAFAVGNSGTIVHYDGRTWNEISSGTTNDLYAIWGNSRNDVFVVGASGMILHYDGSTWSEMSSGTINRLLGVWGSSGTDVFAVGSQGTILHYGTLNGGGTQSGCFINTMF